MAAICRRRPGAAPMDYAPSGPGIKSTAAALLGVDSWTATPRGEFLVRNTAAKVLGQKSTYMNLHPEVLSTVQKRVLRRLGPIITQREFHLVGGTALAIYLGHRHSVDLDWFTGEPMDDSLRLAQDLRGRGISFVTGQISGGTLHGSVSSVRVSFLEYRYPLLQAPIAWPEFGCLLASLDDLACMKLSAVAQRGSKKDFIDIYALGQKHCPLREMLRLYQQKYTIDDTGHVLYGLAYFDQANREAQATIPASIEGGLLFRDVDPRYRADQPNCVEARCLAHSPTLAHVVHRRMGL
jgi:hypothetical protein